MGGSNTSNGPGKKGSKYWIQQAVNHSKNRNILLKEINNSLKNTIKNIDWISPLSDKNYKEYTLNSKYLEDISFFNFAKTKGIFDFWPSRQSQWDAIGIGDKNILILVEAKANTPEIKQRISLSASDKGKESYKKRKEIIFKTLGEDEKWLNCYYQIANRFVFQNEIKNKISSKNVILVFIYFINDESYISTTKQEFLNKLIDVMPSNRFHEGIDYIKIFINCKELQQKFPYIKD